MIRRFLRWLARREMDVLIQESMRDVFLKEQRAHELGMWQGQLQGQKHMAEEIERAAKERGGLEVLAQDVSLARKRMVH